MTETNRPIGPAPSGSIGIFVYDGVEPIDLGGTFGVFSMARRVVPGLSFFTVAENDQVVTLASELRILPDHDFKTCPTPDALIVCGGPGWVQEREKPAVLDFIRQQARKSLVASVCTGGLILAATDLLDGRTATTRRMGIGDEEPPLALLGRKHRDVATVEALVVDCGQLVTGGGVSLAIDLSLHLLGRLFDPETAAETARIIEYEAAWQANKARLPILDRRGAA